MTKEQEILLLEKFIEQTPADTYLQPVLRWLLPQFSRDVKADIFTDVNLEELHTEVKGLLIQRDLFKAQIKSHNEEELKWSDRVAYLRREESRLRTAILDLKRLIRDIET